MAEQYDPVQHFAELKEQRIQEILDEANRYNGDFRLRKLAERVFDLEASIHRAEAVLIEEAFQSTLWLARKQAEENE